MLPQWQNIHCFSNPNLPLFPTISQVSMIKAPKSDHLISQKTAAAWPSEQWGMEEVMEYTEATIRIETLTISRVRNRLSDAVGGHENSQRHKWTDPTGILETQCPGESASEGKQYPTVPLIEKKDFSAKLPRRSPGTHFSPSTNANCLQRMHRCKPIEVIQPFAEALCPKVSAELIPPRGQSVMP